MKALMRVYRNIKLHVIFAALCIFIPHTTNGVGRNPSPGVSLRVGSISFTPTKWDKDSNIKVIEQRATDAAHRGADLLVFPEGALDGYVINEVNAAIGTPEYPSLVSKFLQLAEPLNGTYIQRVKTLARSLQVHIVLGFLQKNGTTDQVHNAAALFDVQGNIALIYHKVHFAQGYTINPPCYAPGSDFPVAKTTFGTTGIMICFDRQLPETARNLRLAGAQLLVNPSYGSFSRANSSGQDGWNTRLLQTRAYENGVPLIFTNPGQSLILDDHGEFVAVGTANETVYADIMISSEDFSALPPATLQYRRPPLYTSLVHGTDPAIVPGERCGTP